MELISFARRLMELAVLMNIVNNLAVQCCQHVAPDATQFSHSVYLEPRRSQQKRSTYKHFKIHLSYDQSLQNLSAEKMTFIQDHLLPKAVNYWEETLKVKRFHSNIKILRQCKSEKVRYRDNDSRPFCVDGCADSTFCGDVEVPESHLDSCRQIDESGDFEVSRDIGEGVDGADFILYVSSLSLPRCKIESTVAYAAYCRLEGRLDRPVAGYVNMCPESISTRSFDEHQMHFTIKHEILHALGFSSGLFAFFRDKHGEPLTKRSPATNKPPYDHENKRYQWSDRVVRTVTRHDWLVRKGAIKKTTSVVVTPSVVMEVRNHFNCSTAEGAELEDQGMLGTSLTHWEKRVFENEVMTGTYTQNLVISRITLALMEDTGWYRVNYEKAGDFKWGRNLGCDFVQKSCHSWMESRKARNESIHPFCERIKSRSIQTECNQDGTAVALCNLVAYESSLPEEYQHFKDIPGKDATLYGGSVALADYCPYVQEFNWKKEEVVVRGSRCTMSANNPTEEENYLAEKYGKNSMCLEHSSDWSVQYCETVHRVESWGSGCYEFSCDNQGLVVDFNGIPYRCSHAGQVIAVEVVSYDWLHRGTVICPKVPSMCPNFTGSLLPVDVARRAKVTTAPCSAVSDLLAGDLNRRRRLLVIIFILVFVNRSL